jgi:hypothetical protein
MKLESGKHYTLRCGGIVGPVEPISPNSNYYKDPAGAQWQAEGGRAAGFVLMKDCPFDIIAESRIPILEEGKRYVDDSGNIVGPLVRYDDVFGTGNHSYSVSGRRLDDNDARDIVSEYVEPSLATGVASGWRPIGTAPEDMPVLVRRSANVSPSVAYRDRAGRWVQYDAGFVLHGLTEWHPLPQ